MPKGVMWEHRALYNSLGGGGNAALGEKASESVEEQRDRVAQEARGQRLLPACPLMHGTGLFTAINALAGGGAIVTIRSKHLDAEELWSTIEARGANACAIVGDAFAKPMLKALAGEPRALGSLEVPAARLVGRDVEPARQAGASRGDPARAALRLVRIERGGRLRRRADDEGQHGRARQVPHRAELQGVHARRQGGGAGQRREGLHRALAVRSRSATTRTRRRAPRPSRPTRIAAGRSPATGAR